MNRSDSIAKLATALVAANLELRPIAKDSTNPHFKSKFASLDAIMSDVRPILAKHGLAIVQGATTPHTNEHSVVTAFTVETLLVHSSGEWVQSSVVMPIVKSDPQGAGAALTYGRRYGVSALLGLSTDEDDDGNSASQGKRGERAGRERAAASVGHPATERETGTGATAPTRAAFVDQTKVLPFGKNKGTPLTLMAPKDLAAALEWAKGNKPDAYAGFIAAAETILDDAREPVTT